MQDWRDSDLEALFRKMREIDRESAAPFQSDWELARSRMAAPRTSFRYVIATVSVIVLALSAAVVVKIVRPPSPGQHQTADSQDLNRGLRDLVGRYPVAPAIPAPPQPTPGRPLPGVPGGQVSGIKPVRPSGRVRRGTSRTNDYQEQSLISTWRSPTDFLLKSPTDDLMTTVPDIRQSLVRIDGR